MTTNKKKVGNQFYESANVKNRNRNKTPAGQPHQQHQKRKK